MRIVFMGTPNFASPSLKKLAALHDVVLCLTRPDAVRGRGKKLVASPVAQIAEELGIAMLKTNRIDDDVLAQIREAAPDIICVAAYGCILPDALLELAPYGCINVHASLLPKWRGAAPIQRALMAGEEELGISIMRIVHELDAGAYMRQASIQVGEKACAELMQELAELGARELIAALELIAQGKDEWVEQDVEQVSYAPKVEKHEILLSPQDSAQANRLRIRAALPTSPARFLVSGKGMRATAARMAQDGPQSLEPEALLVEGGRVFLGCSDGALELLRIQPDGKREMQAAEWARGQHSIEQSWSHV